MRPQSMSLSKAHSISESALQPGKDSPHRNDSHRSDAHTPIASFLSTASSSTSSLLPVQGEKTPHPSTLSRIHSFVISESGYYATTLSFYRKMDSASFFLAWECIHPREKDSRGAYIEGERDKEIWMPTSVCLISRWPYFGVMRNILMGIYPRLRAEQDITKVLDDLMADVTRVPIPPSGNTMLRFKLDDKVVSCKAAPAINVPLVDFPLRMVFQLLSAENVLTLLTCLLLEQRFIFFSSNHALLTPVIEGILALLYPFQWEHIYIPVLPSSLRSFVEAPWPYLCGLHSRYLKEILEELDASPTPNPVIVNLDTSTVTLPTDSVIPLLPARFREEFLAAFRAIPMHYEVYAANSAVFDPESDMAARAAHAETVDNELRHLGLGLMVSLFGSIRSFTAFEFNPPILQVDNFLKQQNDDMHGFYNQVFSTGSFRIFKKSRHKHEKDYFDLYASKAGRALDTSGEPPVVVHLPPFENPAPPQQVAGKRTSFLGVAFGNRERSSSAPTSPKSLRRVADDTGSVKGGPTYCERVIDMLSRMLEQPGPRAHLLHLRGVYRVARGDVVDGLSDFDEILKVHPLRFPKDLVMDILSSLEPHELDAFQRTSFAANKVWAELMDSLKHANDESDGDYRLPEIGSFASVMKAVAAGDALDADSFSSITKLLGITDDTVSAHSLFNALVTVESGSGEVTSKSTVSSTLFTQFVETWRGMSQNTHGLHLEGLVEMRPGEAIIKTVPLIRISDVGVGTLVLTHFRLFLVKSENSVFHITDLDTITSIRKFQFKIIIPPGVPAIKVAFMSSRTAESENIARNLMQLSSSTVEEPLGEGVKENTLLFFSERDPWYSYLLEMAMGHKLALTTKDPSMITKAAHNVELAEAILKMCSRAGSSSGRLKDFDPIAQMKKMLPFSNPETQPKKIPQSALAFFVRQIDITPMEHSKSTVESLVSNAKDTIWCGLGDGFIQIIENLQLGPRIKMHKQRITSMLCTGDSVWTASFDGTMQVIDATSRRSMTSLTSSDVVSTLINGDDGTLWCATLSGDITQWDCKTYQQRDRKSVV